MCSPASYNGQDSFPKQRFIQPQTSLELWLRNTALNSLVAQLVKNLPVMQETQIRFLDGQDPLEKEMATHSNILAWRIPWAEEPGRL